MKFTIISGSHRQQSQSAKVGRFIERTLKEQGLCDETWFNLADPFPLWDESIWEGTRNGKSDWSPYRGTGLQRRLRGNSARWHGMVPSGLKNFFLMWGKGELAHKPTVMRRIQERQRPIAELRMSSYKNNRITTSPSS